MHKSALEAVVSEQLNFDSSLEEIYLHEFR